MFLIHGNVIKFYNNYKRIQTTKKYNFTDKVNGIMYSVFKRFEKNDCVQQKIIRLVI